MASDSGRRATPIDILQTDYEYATISRYVEGQRNDLGEPQRTLTTRSTSVKCAIDALTRAPAYVTRGGLREVLKQGIVEASVFIMTLSADETIEPGDVVIDCNGADYDVVHVINWHTHTEAFLRKMN